MRRWRLTTWVYAGLAVLLVVSVVLTVALWSRPWVHEWMPNFIAEWSGLLLAVTIVDRLLERARDAQRAERREPLRRLAGNLLGHALSGLINTAVAAYAHEQPQGHEEDPEPAGEFISRWAPTVGQSRRARDADWIYLLSNTFETSETAVTNVRAQYLTALDEPEIADVDALAQQLRAGASIMRAWARDIDPDHEPQGAQALLPRLTADAVGRSVGGTCIQVAAAFAAVAADYRALTGEELTTASGWTQVRFVRSMLALIERRPADDEDELATREPV